MLIGLKARSYRLPKPGTLYESAEIHEGKFLSLSSYPAEEAFRAYRLSP